jgi:two-component system chemotaxis sensor kinase CheA
VRIEFSGQETGLDKSLLEAIKDPLTHAVRNAVDHGIEAPADRVLAGKPAEGCVRLKAFHQSGSVVIEVSDDGGGIAIERVLNKAVERGLVTPEQAAEMTEREALQLIFLPGFSTASAVTTVSGRGVGLDVFAPTWRRLAAVLSWSRRLARERPCGCGFR